MIVWFVVDAESFLNTLGSGAGEGCSGMDGALILYAIFAAILSFFLHLLVRWVSLCATTTKCKAALLAWSDLFYNGAVGCFGGSVLLAAAGTTLEVWGYFAPRILQYGGIAVVFGCISAALQACANRLDKNERRVAAGL